MRLSTSLLLFVSLATYCSWAIAACTTNSDCSNQPYSICSSTSTSPTAVNCTLIPGFGVDASTQKIYFLGRCGGSIDPSSGVSSNPGTVHLFSANLDGTGIASLSILSENVGANAGGNYSEVSEFLTLSPYDFYIVRNVRDAIAFDIIDRTTLQESLTFEQRNNPRPSFSFDLVNGFTYSCLYFNVVRFSSILTTPAYNTTYTVLYNRSAFPDSLVCEYVQAVGSDLYILAGGSPNGSVVFRGNLNGAPLEPLFNIFTGRLSEIAVNTNAIYYSDQFSVNRYFLNPSIRGPTLLFPDHTPSPNFTSIQVVGDEVYYDDGVFIRRTNTTSLAAEDLIPSTFPFGTTSSSSGSGVCACRPGFTGSDCSTCNGGQIQWSNGIPSCVTLSDNGFPSSCSFDYQCGSQPFSQCVNSKCACRGGFSGRLCGTCNGVVTWAAGVPNCTVSESSSATASSGTATSSDPATSSDSAPRSSNSTSPTNSTSPSSCPVTISQTIRTSWTDGTNTYYIYDISIHDVGTQSVVTPIFFIRSTTTLGVAITESWNLVTYATTVPTQVLVSLLPNTTINAGAFYTGAGYIIRNTQTTLELDSCVSVSPPPSTSPTPAPTPTPSPSMPPPGAVSCNNVNLTQTLRTSWSDGTVTSYLYDVTIINHNASTIYTPVFQIKTTSATNNLQINQSWNLVLFATTVPSQRLASLVPNTNIAAGSSFSGAGYVSIGSPTTIVLTQCYNPLA